MKIKKSVNNNSAFCLSACAARQSAATARRRLPSVFPRGFTLIELLLVIALMAMIIGITTPAFVGLTRGAGMRGAIAQVSSTLSLLRQWAITKHENVTFYFFDGGSTTASYYYAANDIGTIIDKTNELPMDVKFSSGGTITFKADGSLYSPLGIIPPAESITIEDRKFPGDANKAKRISVYKLTGGIVVE